MAVRSERILTMFVGGLLSLVVLALPTGADLVADPYEPNDDWDEAWGPLEVRTTYAAEVTTDSDRDFFYFDVGVSGDVALTLRREPGVNDGFIPKTVGLMLYNSDEAPVEFLSAELGTPARQTWSLSPGRYFFELSADTDDGDSPVPYEIRLVSEVLEADTPTPGPREPITDPGRCAYFPKTGR